MLGLFGHRVPSDAFSNELWSGSMTVSPLPEDLTRGALSLGKFEPSPVSAFDVAIAVELVARLPLDRCHP